jgi:hypothetical protein
VQAKGSQWVGFQAGFLAALAAHAVQPQDGRFAGQTDEVQAMTYRDMHEIAVDHLGYECILTALEDLERLKALAASPTQPEGGEWGPYQYAAQLATYAAKKVGCVPEWKPLPDLMGVLTQIDNCLAGLVASPPRGEAQPEQVAREALEAMDKAASWTECRTVARAALAKMGGAKS